eukprot:8416626-Karenia_brevis.AAC.1
MQEKVTIASFASLEAQQMKEFLERFPEDLATAYGLDSAADYNIFNKMLTARLPRLRRLCLPQLRSSWLTSMDLSMNPLVLGNF